VLGEAKLISVTKSESSKAKLVGGESVKGQK